MKALEEHAQQAPARYPSLAKIMDEYEDGILLYRIEQDEVWKKVTLSDSVLRVYYNNTKDNYRWQERVNFAEIYVLKDSLAKAIYKQLKRGKDFMELAYKYTARPGYKEKKGEWGFQPFAQNDLSNRASKMANDSITEPFRNGAGWSILKRIAVDSAHVKTFDEALSEVANSYQETASKEREQQWIESLYKKYPVQINKEILAIAFKGKHAGS